MNKERRRLFNRPLAWRGHARGAAWLVLAALSAGLATQAYFDPRPPLKVATRAAPQTGTSFAPGLQKEIAALDARSQNLAHLQREAQARLAALEEQLASITGSLPAQAPATEQPPASEAARIISTEFAVELASATDIGEIDAVWQALQQVYGAELKPLQPAVRLAGTAASRELVLVAGPLANAEDAARICAALRAGGQSCREAQFAGEIIRLGATTPTQTE